MTTCKHPNEILDEHEGTIICTDCGIIKNHIFLAPNDNYKNEIINFGYLDNILAKFSSEELSNIPINLQKNFELNNKKTASEIYKISKKNNSNILLKDISTLFKVKLKDIKTDPINLIEINNILERYTKIFNLDYKSFTQIRRKISQFKNTGYQPLTIIGSLIYLHFADTDKKQSIKYCAEKLQISPISIYRFIKKYKP